MGYLIINYKQIILFFQYKNDELCNPYINSIHIPAAKKRIENNEDLGRRSPIENMLSLFDEGGAVMWLHSFD